MRRWRMRWSDCVSAALSEKRCDNRAGRANNIQLLHRFFNHLHLYFKAWMQVESIDNVQGILLLFLISQIEGEHHENRTIDEKSVSLLETPGMDHRLRDL